jgi:lipoate---protein ligase
MVYLIRKETDPYFNLAAEEYLLKNGPGEIFMLWQNDPCVVIGKHQNAFAEVNVPFAFDNNIKIIRRISGGGAVYHDKGNVNFTFIAEAEKGKQVDFLRFLKPLAEILNLTGLNVEIGKRNDLLLHGKKFSGNAEHVFKNKVIHHGTLLFDTDLDVLDSVLDAPKNKFSGKALPSVRSVVTNLTSFLKDINNIEVFIDKLITSWLNINPQSTEFQLSTLDREEIEKLAVERYRKDSWNFGYSPDFEMFFNFRENAYQLKVKTGMIIEVNSATQKYDEIFRHLIGNGFSYSNIKSFISENIAPLELSTSEAENLLHNFFN